MVYIVVPTLVILGAVGLVIWLLKWTASTKDWCVMMYFVAQNHDDLDAKLEQVLEALKALPCNSKSGEASETGWGNVHVLYRALWNDPKKDPEAGVIHWRPLAPKKKTFGGAATVGDLSADLHGFFDWAYDTCPAHRYAVFFWGHSFGPGGIFEVNQPVIVDPPPSPVLAWQGLSLPVVSQELAQIVEKRKAGFHLDVGGRPTDKTRLGPLPISPPVPPSPPSSSPTPTPPGPVPPLPFPPAMKVEVVLFQDCWMSTLETMYTLENSVQYVIGSQSLVPIGLDMNGAPVATAIWPYRQLIDSLLTQPQFADAMLQQMKQYYDAAPANRFPTPCVPYSLLDLGPDAGYVSSVLTAPFQQLVTALQPLGKSGRKQLIESKPTQSGRFYRYVDGTLRVGEVALIDVVTLCDYLQSSAAFVGVTFPAGQDVAIQAAAAAVHQTLLGNGATPTPALVRGTFESVNTAADQVGFKGVSVLFKGDWWASDSTLMYAVSKGTYDTLAFAQNARTPPLPAPPAACWTMYAFEHSRSDTTGLTCT